MAAVLFLKEPHQDDDQIESQSFTQRNQNSNERTVKIRKNNSIVADWCLKYCEYIIPPRDGIKPKTIAEPHSTRSVRPHDELDHSKIKKIVLV